MALTSISKDNKTAVSADDWIIPLWVGEARGLVRVAVVDKDIP